MSGEEFFNRLAFLNEREQKELYPPCAICGEPTKENDVAEMAYRRAPGTTDDEWLVMQEKPQGIVHPDCGLQAGMEQA